MPEQDVDNLVAGMLEGEAITPSVPVDDSSRPRENTGENANSRQGFAWAADCYWVYEHLGEKMNRTKCGSAARWAVWQMANKDIAFFVNQIMPKAMTLWEKNREKQGDDQMNAREERKEIAVLQRILEAAVAESAR